MSDLLRLLFLFFLLLLALCFPFQVKAGYPPFTDIDPNVIYVGNEVFIGYDPLQSPCLQALPNYQGLTEHIAYEDNSFIDITIVALGTSPCLNIGVENPPYQYYSLGVLPEGDYTVQMYWTDNSVALPVTQPSLRIPVGDLLQFSVLGSPVPVSALSNSGLLLLVFSLLITAIRFYGIGNHR